MDAAMEQVNVGDTIKVWWGAKMATVIRISSHESGKRGWLVLHFGDGHAMTYTPGMSLEKINDKCHK